MGLNKKPSGFLIINKQKDVTSHDVIDEIRKITGQQKAGHAGTLDPFATGVLVVGINKATRLLEFVESKSKTYLATLSLGKTSDTYDRTGIIQTSASPSKPTKKEIKNVLNLFIGTVEQRPPAHSAIKINGRRLYKIARQARATGRAIEKQIDIPARKVNIISIKLISYDYPSLKIKTVTGKGAYIRSLAHDIGQKLKTGALLEELERRAIDNFQIEDSISIPDLARLNDEWTRKLIPMETAVTTMPRINLRPRQTINVINGIKIENPNPRRFQKETLIALFDQKGNLTAIGQISKDSRSIQPKKVLA